METPDKQLVADWLAAAGRAEVVAGLEGIYAGVAEAVTARGPACWASGRCCNFAKTGHRLYATGLETAYTIKRLSEPLTEERLAAAVESGGCPFQVLNLCGVHGIRPLGCRVYFCDRSATEWQRELYEGAMKALRGLHDQCGIEYRYGEWRGMLGRFVSRIGNGAEEQ